VSTEVGKPAARRNPAEVTYGAGDIAAMNLVLWRFWLSVTGIIAAVIIAVPIVLLVLDGYPLADSVNAIDWWFTGLVILIVLIWLIVATAVKYWWNSRKGLHGPIQFALTDEGVSFRSRQMEGVAFWTTIKSVKTIGNRAYLFIGPRTGFIIPRRAFDSDAEFAAFAFEASERWEARRER